MIGTTIADNIKITVQRSFLDINKWEMVVSEQYSVVDIDTIAVLFNADLDTMIENAKKYDGVYYKESGINEYNGCHLLFITTIPVSQFTFMFVSMSMLIFVFMLVSINMYMYIYVYYNIIRNKSKRNHINLSNFIFLSITFFTLSYSDFTQYNFTVN